MADLTSIPEPEALAVDPGDPVAAAVRTALVAGVARLRSSDPAARDGKVEGVHRMRTATRRLRCALRTFRPVLDAEWVRPLEVELKWLAEVLGAVRDLDVLGERLRRASGDSAEALTPLFLALGRRHESASVALHDALRDGRYRDLVDRLAEAADRPSFREEASAPCRSALPPLVARCWRSLKKAARALGPDDPDDDFHDVRKRVKRARYAAEAVAGALDDRAARAARRFARLATAVQDVLGEHQDATIAADEVARVVAQHPSDGPFNLAAGRLLERQACAAARARAEFFDAWDRLDRKKCARWLLAR